MQDWLFGRLDSYPAGYPAVIPPPVPTHLYQASEEQVGLWMVDQQERQTKSVSALYDLKNWVAVNSSVNLPYESWLQMPAAVRNALINEVNELVRERNRVNQQAQERLQASLQGNNTGKLTFPVQPKSFTENLFR